MNHRIGVSRMRIAALLVLFLLIFAQTSTAEAVLQGNVVGVTDGDTLTILDENKQQHRIRLAAIDAPESKQPFGTRSKQLLSSLCFGRHAEVRNTSADRYQRVVGTVYCNGVDANAELVRQGMAWVYVHYARRDSPLFELERIARSEKIGLWADPDAIPPWEWRRGNHTVGASAQKNQIATEHNKVRGNRRSNVYHLPHCPNYESVGTGNRVPFASKQEALVAGFRRAGNC